MAAVAFLFGFEGRVARGRFWIFGLVLYAAAALALAAVPESRATLETIIWVPASAALILYVFVGMWGFSIAVLMMAADLFVVTGTGGRVILAPFLASIALCVALGWMVVAVAAKRLHDRGKSGWWLLLFVVAPLVLMETGAITSDDAARAPLALAALALHGWSFVELGCRRGVAGPNRFGPEPSA